MIQLLLSGFCQRPSLSNSTCALFGWRIWVGLEEFVCGNGCYFLQEFVFVCFEPDKTDFSPGQCLIRNVSISWQATLLALKSPQLDMGSKDLIKHLKWDYTHSWGMWIETGICSNILAGSRWKLFAAAAKSHQSCSTLCNPTDGSPPASRLRDSPGKNTGVGCHFLLQCVKVKSFSCVRLFTTPWTVAHQAPPSMGFSRQEYWSGLPLPSPESFLTSL